MTHQDPKATGLQFTIKGAKNMLTIQKDSKTYKMLKSSADTKGMDIQDYIYNMLEAEIKEYEKKNGMAKLISR